MSKKPPAPARRIPPSIAIVLGVAGLVVLALATLYATRRQLAREAVAGWLRARGVAAASEFQELGPGHLVGRLRIGAANDPDVTVERAEISYSLTGLLTGRGVQVTDVRLVHPVLKGEWRGGRFSAGALDPLIAEFVKRPPTPGAPSPRVRIEGGELRLATDYGQLNARLDAAIEGGRLASLEARTAPGVLRVAGLEADLGPGEITARASDGRVKLRLAAPFRTARMTAASAADGRLTLDGDLSYPDLKAAEVTGGTLTAALEAGAAQASGARARGIAISGGSPDFRWTRAGGDQVGGTLIARCDLKELTASDLRLADARGDFKGAFKHGFSGGRETSLRLDGRAETAGGWSGLGAPAKGDSGEIIAVKRGLRAFRASAAGVSIAADGHGLQARLTDAAWLRPDAGGEVRLVPVRSGYRLTTAGGGLPVIAANVRRFAFAGGGAVADGDLSAKLSVGPLERLDVHTAGSLKIAGGAANLNASRCADVTVAHVELGQNDVEHFSGRLCPATGPLFRIGQGGWALSARAEQAAAAAPFLQASLADGAGTVRMADQAGRLSADVAIASARVMDESKELRFHPLLLSGRAGLARDLWTAALDFRRPEGAAVAHAELRHGADGAGGVEVTTPELAFVPGGLQPADLSPLAKALGDRVAGPVRFTGHFRWAGEQTTSGGELVIPDLDLKSPLGQVTGLAGQVAFSSLAPLIAPPGQRLHVARVAAMLPLTDLDASFSLSETEILAAGEAAGGGGRLTMADLRVPLQPGAPIKGTVQLDAVQVHDFVAATPFADRMELNAKVSGRIPFETAGGKLRIAGGALHAVEPGRLTVSRTALSSMSAQGAVQAPGPAQEQVGTNDTFSDFAYQALENLAFNKLDAQVSSTGDGRLGVRFHIVGYHDPPKQEAIKLSWMDVLMRRVPQRLPLPSGTDVNLTLDTSLNLDELLADYGDYERRRSSPKVQP